MSDTPLSRPPVERLAYSIDEALQAVPISRRKIASLIATGELPVAYIGDRPMIPTAALAALVTPACA